MPTYDYTCDACGHNWEEFQSMSSSPKRKCPACGKLKARRLIGAGGGIIFKGSGFYVTDYKNKRAPSSESSPAKKESSSNTSSTSSSSSSDGSGES